MVYEEGTQWKQTNKQTNKQKKKKKKKNPYINTYVTKEGGFLGTQGLFFAHFTTFAYAFFHRYFF